MESDCLLLWPVFSRSRLIPSPWSILQGFDPYLTFQVCPSCQDLYHLCEDAGMRSTRDLTEEERKQKTRGKGKRKQSSSGQDKAAKKSRQNALSEEHLNISNFNTKTSASGVRADPQKAGEEDWQCRVCDENAGKPGDYGVQVG